MRKGLIVVGLTGGIGSGKSTVASLFQEFGADVADADALAHQALDLPAVKRQLIRVFGPSVCRRGRIDRAALARVAFSRDRDVKRLNAIVHPAVRRGLQSAQRRARRPIFVIDAPLLLEAGVDRDCAIVVFVDAPRAARLRRVARRGWSPAELRRRERFQWPMARKRKRADYVVDNGGHRTLTRRQVFRIYQELTS